MAPRPLLAAEEDRVGARLVKIAVMVAVVGNNDGYREILGVSADELAALAASP